MMCDLRLGIEITNRKSIITIHKSTALS